MATYKVPQDVEADDKLIGPFSFKQFVFVLIAIGMGWLSYMMFRVSPVMVVIPLPFTLIFAILGLPLRKDQPTDVYVAALINFWLRPKARLWDQEGIAEHVIVTVPKKVEISYTDNLSQGQVLSRLNVLAQTMDTRGTSSLPSALNEYGVAGYDFNQNSDRLVAVAVPVQQVADSAVDISEADDVLDVKNSKIAQTISRLERTKTAPVKITQAPQAEAPAGQKPVAPGRVFMPNNTSSEDTLQDTLKESPEVEVAVDLEANPYPSGMHQQVITPLKGSVAPVENGSTPKPEKQMTQSQSTDTIKVDDSASAKNDSAPSKPSFEEGGEISLH